MTYALFTNSVLSQFFFQKMCLRAMLFIELKSYGIVIIFLDVLNLYQAKVLCTVHHGKLTDVIVKLRQPAAKTPCKCGSRGGIYNNRRKRRFSNEIVRTACPIKALLQLGESVTVCAVVADCKKSGRLQVN